jgi:hypothetical protein
MLNATVAAKGLEYSIFFGSRTGTARRRTDAVAASVVKWIVGQEIRIAVASDRCPIAARARPQDRATLD